MEGWTPLLCATEFNLIEAVKLFVSHGANIEARTMCGMTALSRASEKGLYKIVKYLLEQGVNIEAALGRHGIYRCFYL
jgi:ankyrin repeat protein